MSISDQLKEMGFEPALIERAVRETGNVDIEHAMEWILSNPTDFTPGPSASSSAEKTSAQSVTSEQSATSTKEEDPVPDDQKTAEGQKAKSMKCDDCGKLFPNEDALVWHASKSGHSNFSESCEEIKPKSPEEIKAAREALEARIKANRKIREEKERQEELERERARRNQGREIVELRQKFQEDEMKRAAEARRRDKLEDAAARKKILEQIEQDREERRRLANPQVNKVPNAVSVNRVAAPTEPKNYDSTRLQIRLTNGQALTQSFSASEALASVRCYVLTNRTDGDVPFQMMTTFPRKVFTEEDMTRSLKDLNLCPSAVLTLTKQVTPI